MANSHKVPPIFDENKDDYELWKKDIDLWRLVTDISENKHAIVVHLSLSGRARAASSELSVEELKSDSGFKKLIEKLDRVFLQDPNWKCFHAYLALESYRRPNDCSIDEYLSEFDRRYHKLKECKVSLPDAVVACRLLKSCNLSEMHFQLALSTTTNMTLDDMRATLKKLFAETSSSIDGDRDVAVKVESSDTYYATSNRDKWRSVRRREQQSPVTYRVENRDKRLNPLDSNGKVSLCTVCSSKMHWARKCPHAYERQQSFALYSDVQSVSEEDAEVQVTLFSTEKTFNSGIDTLLGETIGSVLLDCGCTKTVCGELWLQCYLETLNDVERTQIKYEKTHGMYKFGDGNLFAATKCIVFPCVLAGKAVRIRSDVVTCNVPLLLSRQSMRKAGMVINTGNDSATVFGKELKLSSTSNGHYTLPIYRALTEATIEHVLMSSDIVNNEKKALKLHRQFAHPSSEKLISLLKSAELGSAELISCVNKVTESCEVCRRYKKPRPRPVVAMNMGKTFNDAVAMDLKVWQPNVYFLVMVDIATRFCSAVVINNKSADTVIRELFIHWITMFGAPRKLLSDNGGEFNNETMRSVADCFSIKLVCTAAESPWSNSVCERLNGIIGNSVKKIVEDCHCDVHIALSWAVSAHNALHNYQGYAPNQLVFGYNPVLPSIFNDSPASLEKKTSSQIVADNLNAMAKARVEFVRNESNEKIRRALLHQVRSSNTEDLTNGDSVYYKRNDDDRWRGPGVVIGRDGKQVLVRHGGTYVRVHVCRLQHAPTSGDFVQNTAPMDDPSPTTSLLPSKPVAVSPTQRTCIDDDEESTNKDLFPLRAHEESTNRDSIPLRDTVDQSFVTPSRVTPSKPAIGKRIECWLKNDGGHFKAKVLSRAGKAGGLYGACYNIERESGEIEWIDLVRQVDKWRPVPDDEDVLIASNDDRVLQAKQAEIVNWKNNAVFEEVSDIGQECISLRWVLTEKMKEGIPTVKARLVARGFEEVLEERKDSPTCSRDALRVAITLIAAHGWQCHSIDIKAAFLQGESINRDVYVRPPIEFRHTTVWKLRKTVYGLCDAARAWYLRVKDALLSFGMLMCPLDQALFCWYQEGVLSGIICIHVDDICWAGVTSFQQAVIVKLQKEFLVGSYNTASFKYVGINIDQSHDGSILVDQFDYVKRLKEIGVDGYVHCSRSVALSPVDREEYRALIGQLNWLSTQTRPDISFEVCRLSSVFDQATVDDLICANKIVRKLKATPVKIFFSRLRDVSDCSVECYSDAAFGNLSNGGSQGGYVIFITDSDGNRCVVTWQSKRIKRVVKSTLAAETLALLDCAEAGVYVAKLLSESLKKSILSFPVKCFVDNKSLVESVYSTKAVEDKYLRINISVLRDMLASKDIHSVSWVRATKQLANVLTKRGASGDALLSAVSGASTSS